MGHTLSMKRGSKSPERAPLGLPSSSHWILACLKAVTARNLRGKGNKREEESGALRITQWGFRGNIKSIIAGTKMKIQNDVSSMLLHGYQGKHKPAETKIRYIFGFRSGWLFTIKHKLWKSTSCYSNQK